MSSIISPADYGPVELAHACMAHYLTDVLKAQGSRSHGEGA